ncbi:hypothetical protein GGP76_003203 [Salinibacter ruber]|nr:hypothetical protein [Salinibacter ruber]
MRSGAENSTQKEMPREQESVPRKDASCEDEPWESQVDIDDIEV